MRVTLKTHVQTPIDIPSNLETVLELKSLISTKTKIPVDNQRLVLSSGQILQPNHSELSIFPNLKENCVIHVTKALKIVAPPSQTLPQPREETDEIRSLMNSPLMESMFSNTDMISEILQRSPQIQNLVKNNPDAAHVLHNPEFMRQTMQFVRNPKAMQEMLKSQDRQLSNIEAHPGGFNLLTQMYRSTQDGSSECVKIEEDPVVVAANKILADRYGVSPVSPKAINTVALPNLWAPPPSPTFSPHIRSSTQAPEPGTISSTEFLETIHSHHQARHPLRYLFDLQCGQIMRESRERNRGLSGESPSVYDPTAAERQAADSEHFQRQAENRARIAKINEEKNAERERETAFVAANEPKYKDELKELDEMGFIDKNKNIKALLASAGNVQGAVIYLLEN